MASRHPRPQPSAWPCLLVLVAAVACHQTRAARPEVSPPLAVDAPEAAARQAALADPAAGVALTSAEAIAHALSRVTFGARPGDAERVARIGLSAFLEEQLHPERLDDSALERRLASSPIAGQSTQDLLRGLKKLQEMRKEQQARGEERGRQGMVSTEGLKPKKEIVEALAEEKVLRAALSSRQLQEVMVDFWFNHFNIFAGKERLAAYLPDYENNVIRANALGSFPELLRAVAHSPAMLIYLDNWRSTAAAAPGVLSPRGLDRFGRPRPQRLVRPPRKLPGLNENYGRELLELHTLGVDGGYSQRDVIEVARCFTGWSVADADDDPRFKFKVMLHDQGPKTVLGERLEPGGGERDGDRVLELLARHPATARFLSRKLARRFVNDDPPPALVERMAATYLQTSGDVRSMLRTLFASPEFWSRRAQHGKLRSPLEAAIAQVRSLDAGLDDPEPVARAIARMGEPLFLAIPPTGYPDGEGTWLSSGSLLSRVDFALQLAAGRLAGVRVDVTRVAQAVQRNPGSERVAPDVAAAEALLSQAALRVGAPALSESTRRAIVDAVAEDAARPQVLPAALAQRAVGLVLASPEMQRR